MARTSNTGQNHGIMVNPTTEGSRAQVPKVIKSDEKLYMFFFGLELVQLHTTLSVKLFPLDICQHLQPLESSETGFEWISI